MTKDKNEKPGEEVPGPRMLPVVAVHGKLYFVDQRLRELRCVTNPHERLPLSMAEGRAFLKIRAEDLPRPDIEQ